MTDLIIIGLLIISNLSLLWVNDRSDRRHQTAIDRLTDKIMAPDLATLRTLDEVKATSAKATTQINHTKASIPSWEADPEEVRSALAREMGREEI